MTAADTATAAEAATLGISDEQLTALRSRGWGDYDTVDGRPGWERAVEIDDGKEMSQWVFPSITGGWMSGWMFPAPLPYCPPQRNADTEGEVRWWNNFDEMLDSCDERAGGRKPAKPGSATKQEDRFAQRTARQK